MVVMGKQYLGTQEDNIRGSCQIGIASAHWRDQVEGKWAAPCEMVSNAGIEQKGW